MCQNKQTNDATTAGILIRYGNVFATNYATSILAGLTLKV
jgi:hypothetical protein